MKYTSMIKSIAAAALVTGSVSVMASGSHGGWYHDSNTGTFVNAHAKSYTSSSTDVMKSRKGSEFADGVSQNSITGTLMNANVPAFEKQTGKGGDEQVTLNGFGGGVYQDKNTGTFTHIY
jgi:hypothetical protein